MSNYYLYLVRCQDDSLYTGITTNLDARIKRHNRGEGAQFTKIKRPVTLVYSEEFDDIRTTMKREKQIKRWSKKKKEELIKYGHPLKKLKIINNKE